MNSTQIISLLLCFTFLTSVARVSGQDNSGIIAVVNKNVHFCVIYDSNLGKLPQKDAAEPMELSNESDWRSLPPNYLCSQNASVVPSVNRSVVVVGRDNCSFSAKAHIAQGVGAGALLIVSDELITPTLNETTDYTGAINITVAVIKTSDFTKLRSLGDDLWVSMYAPKPGHAAYLTLAIIWVIAVATISIGAYWSGVVRYQIYLHKVGLTLPGSRDWLVAEKEGRGEVAITAMVAVIGVMLVVGMLLGLYFFYDYLVYVMIGLFGLAASAALYDCTNAIIQKLPPFATCRLPENRIPWLRSRPEVKNLMLMLLCLGVGVWWIVERHSSYAWMLQDILGVVFCVHMMKKIRLPNLKICCILLLLLFVYDIFFVFITPYFTKNGRSVMIDVATGGDSKSGELLPVAFIVPKLLSAEDLVCMRPYSLLGFGDVLLPGLLISFCHGFDLQANTRRIYYISTLIAYGVGMVVTFVAMDLMQQGQPALLYLVPSVLITISLVGWRRKELAQLWSGAPSVTIQTSASSQAGAREGDEGVGAGGGFTPVCEEEVMETDSGTGSNQLLSSVEPVDESSAPNGVSNGKGPNAM